ncbi:MAG: hypothetical protein U0X91_02185 [Spirosomataceae bacterium]
MKIYNETLLYNQYAQNTVKRFQKAGLLDGGQAAEIQKGHTDVPYNPNFFIKILLFLFGCLGFGFGSSFTALLLMGESFGGFAVVSALYGAGILFALRFFIRERKLHFSGLDNALLYCILGSLMPLIYQIYDALSIQQVWVGALLFLPFLVAAAYSFGEPVVALGAFLTALYIVVDILMKNPLGKALLPFALMGCSGLTYGIIRPLLKKEASFYWAMALEWVSLAALVLFYAAGNYFVVREANAALNGLPSPAPEISFAPVFWAFTFLTPLVFLFTGVRWRNRTLLTLGVIAFTCSILTVRYYHSVLPPEWAMLAGGLVVAAVVYGILQQLKTPKYGFCATLDEADDHTLRIETVVLSQITANIQANDQGLQFGGGDFGGGGAGEKY